MHPLILTLALDPVAQRRFDAERTALFPPGRTQVGAHLTLFHAVPGELLAQVREALTAEAARPMLAVQVVGLRSLGRGVAYDIASPELSDLRERLARRWRSELTPQDRQPFRPHVTVQNKVEPATARATLAALTASFAPFEIQGLGLSLWRYLGGPWESLGILAFHDPDSHDPGSPAPGTVGSVEA
ncbi:MAG: 2'-5' RNA ligase family protein [Sporichthyaceae bacterium]